MVPVARAWYLKKLSCVLPTPLPTSAAQASEGMCPRITAKSAALRH
eukprot:CAMPEP_0172907996 /NCGR_PEP_ID=MMETSP1075-20121228/179890_1 /TAXON_ID=2916 /ORGANISM="Ceratium fusus, Strain PA161109" /LENGTH=45 /DNA_ID= /DNA_START= /DNA_END= /DNA_ORIENTATION=